MPPKDKSRNILGPTSHSYFSQRLRLHYVDWGNHDAPPMLLIHGGRDHCRNWDWVAEAFRKDYHIIAPDLRGHGDSQWMIGGAYSINDYTYDIAQLLHQTKMTPLTIIGHSLGGNISLRYTGLFPENVVKLVAIEGMGPPPSFTQEMASQTNMQRVRGWIKELRDASGRQPRRYKTVEEAYERMQKENPHLSPERAYHLTVHGVNQNEDGSYSWKFDNYVRVFAPRNIEAEALEFQEYWKAITCPVLLFRGTESWATDPLQDGRAAHFSNVQVANVEGAGHWVHHDRLDEFLRITKDFLKG
ncbi:MAG: alpha/beta fold hydrolase [Pseudomonadota bacterium]|jgi:pimeloyl-ACP methyl ester carboxylesterase|nr:alpha/beta hydrolase [Alphaproteobacteria bacterium]